jgi:hypothetical protein
MRFEKIWVEQCRATEAIKRRFGAKSALDYLIGEKLTTFADAARDDPAFAKELPNWVNRRMREKSRSLSLMSTHPASRHDSAMQVRDGRCDGPMRALEDGEHVAF